MKEFNVNIHTLNLLKTLCRANDRTMHFVDLSIVSLSYDVVFSVKGYFLDETIFKCKVSHVTMMAEMFSSGKSKGPA